MTKFVPLIICKGDPFSVWQLHIINLHCYHDDTETWWSEKNVPRSCLKDIPLEKNIERKGVVMIGAGVLQISLQEIKLLGTHEVYIRWWSGLVASLIIGYFKK